MNIEDTIKSEIVNRDATNSNYEKMEYQNSILQLKTYNDNQSYKSDIYTDLKYFIKYYIDSLLERKHGYDEIELDKIFYYFPYLEPIERVKILKYLIRLLKLDGLDHITI